MTGKWCHWEQKLVAGQLAFPRLARPLVECSTQVSSLMVVAPSSPLNRHLPSSLHVIMEQEAQGRLPYPPELASHKAISIHLFVRHRLWNVLKSFFN